MTEHIHRQKSMMGATWAWCAAEDGTLTRLQERVTCPRCIEMVETFRLQREAEKLARSVHAKCEGRPLLRVEFDRRLAWLDQQAREAAVAAGRREVAS